MLASDTDVRDIFDVRLANALRSMGIYTENALVTYIEEDVYREFDWGSESWVTKSSTIGTAKLLHSRGIGRKSLRIIEQHLTSIGFDSAYFTEVNLQKVLHQVRYHLQTALDLITHA